MKLVKLMTIGEGSDKLQSAEILRMVCRAMPEGGDLEEVMKRTRILKVLASTKDTNLVLEDADHEKLAALVKGFKFGIATVELAEILDAVVNAKEPPAPMLQAAE